MQHKGKILEKAVRESGMPLTKLSKKMAKSRRWMYNAFENENLSIDYILEIGKIIHYDFSEDLKDSKSLKNLQNILESTQILRIQNTGRINT